MQGGSACVEMHGSGSSITGRLGGKLEAHCHLAYAFIPFAWFSTLLQRAAVVPAAAV
jgi:hypothetical protein